MSFLAVGPCWVEAEGSEAISTHLCDVELSEGSVPTVAFAELSLAKPGKADGPVCLVVQAEWR